MHALVIFSLSPRLGIWGVSVDGHRSGGVDGHRSGKLDKRGKSVNVHVNTCSIHFGANSRVCSCVYCSAHGSGCVVDGGSATAAI